MILVTLQGPDVKLKSDVDLSRERLEVFRDALDGARFISSTAFIPAQRAIPPIKRLKEANFRVHLSTEVLNVFENVLLHEKHDAHLAKERLTLLKLNSEELGLTLYPFQWEGVEFLMNRKRALLGSEMGTGKTVQAITAVPYKAPVLIVCPAVAKGVWKREIEHWRPDLKPRTLVGMNTFTEWPGPSEALIVNYDILPTPVGKGDYVPLPPTPGGLVSIFDEAHYCKSFRSKRTHASRAIAKRALDANGYAWLLTGTPLQSAPPDLYSVLSVAELEREAFGNWARFTELFGGKKVKVYGGEREITRWATTPDASVHERLKRVMLRRLRSEVLSELPGKTIREVEVETPTDGGRELDALAWTLSKEVDGADWQADPQIIYEATKRSRVAFDTVSKLRMILAELKTPFALELARQYEDSQEPLLIFTAHTSPLRFFAKREGWGIIEGATTSNERAGLEERFQRGELKGLACSIRAAGVALTLTRAAHVMFVDESWTPAENEQAEDRAVRIGQTRGVLVTRLFLDHALDKHVLRVLGRKRRMIGSVVDGRVEP